MSRKEGGDLERNVGLRTLGARGHPAWGLCEHQRQHAQYHPRYSIHSSNWHYRDFKMPWMIGYVIKLITALENTPLNQLFQQNLNKSLSQRHSKRDLNNDKKCHKRMDHKNHLKTHNQQVSPWGSGLKVFQSCRAATALLYCPYPNEQSVFRDLWQ